MIQAGIEARLAVLEQQMNQLLAKSADNAANVDYIAMMTDVEITVEEEVVDHD